jgi:hypothetical protein
MPQRELHPSQCASCTVLAKGPRPLSRSRPRPRSLVAAGERQPRSGRSDRAHSTGPDSFITPNRWVSTTSYSLRSFGCGMWASSFKARYDRRAEPRTSHVSAPCEDGVIPIHAAPAPTPPSSAQSTRLAVNCNADLRASLIAPLPNSTRLVALARATTKPRNRLANYGRQPSEADHRHKLRAAIVRPERHRDRVFCLDWMPWIYVFFRSRERMGKLGTSHSKGPALSPA